MFKVIAIYTTGARQVERTCDTLEEAEKWAGYYNIVNAARARYVVK